MSANIRVDLDMSDEQMKTLISEAIFERLKDGDKEALIKKGILLALSPVDAWHEKRSPLEIAFQQGVTEVAREVVRDFIANSPDVQARIRAEITRTLDTIYEKSDQLRAVVTQEIVTKLYSLE